MTEFYTVSFFGHREVNDYFGIEVQTENIIRALLSSDRYLAFQVGRNGEFDLLVSSIIHRIKKEGYDDNIVHILVLPYDTAEYRNNREIFDKYYDEVEICEKSCTAHYKSAIQIRNKAMVDRSDLVVFYLEYKSGGAYQTYKYAVKQKKKIILINEEDGA
ncbi:MAG: hypothetical protein ACI4F7_03950 [Acutalibacteraceae bacterium]